MPLPHAVLEMVPKVAVSVPSVPPKPPPIVPPLIVVALARLKVGAVVYCEPSPSTVA